MNNSIKKQIQGDLTKAEEKVESKYALEKARTAAVVEGLPAFLAANAGQGKGNEDVKQNIAIPILLVAQSNSKILKPSSPLYHRDLRPGGIYHSLTGEVMPADLKICPVYFNVKWFVWPKISTGKSLGGIFDTAALAEAKCQELLEADPSSEWQVKETHQHFVIAVSGGKMLGLFAMLWSSTKVKASRTLNYLIHSAVSPNNLDRYSVLVGLSTFLATKGEMEYYNVAVQGVEWVTPDIYNEAARFYKALKGGEVEVDTSSADAEME